MDEPLVVLPAMCTFAAKQSLVPATAQRHIMDGREASDDRVGLKQMVSGLNQLLRGRPDLVVCWPTVYSEWRDDLLELARTIGRKGLCWVPAGEEPPWAGPAMPISEGVRGQFLDEAALRRDE